MGRTPKPLNILVINLPDWDEFKELSEQGHAISHQEAAWDVVIGPTCWLMDQDHRKYLDLAIKSARARRYPKENT